MYRINGNAPLLLYEGVDVGAVHLGPRRKVVFCAELRAVRVNRATRVNKIFPVARNWNGDVSRRAPIVIANRNALD